MGLTEMMALLSLGLQVLVAIVTVLWTVSKVARGLRQEAETRHQTYVKKIDEEIESLHKSIGEVGASIRRKITDVEFYVRDNYVTNEMIKNIFTMFSDNMKLQFDVVKESLAAIRDRLDREERS